MAMPSMLKLEMEPEMKTLFVKAAGGQRLYKWAMDLLEQEALRKLGYDSFEEWKESQNE